LGGPEELAVLSIAECDIVELPHRSAPR